MTRDNIVIEIQRRLNLIKTSNGYTFDINLVERNPEEDPDPSRMPSAAIFEFPDVSVDIPRGRRGASQPPIYAREFTILLELWYRSANEGIVSRDVATFLKHTRQVLFSDGITLNGICNTLEEVETSRVYRPCIGNYIGGIGIVLKAVFIEDFANL